MQSKPTTISIIQHPLADIAIAGIRHKNSSPSEFRRCVRTLSTLVGIEGLRQIHTEKTLVQTPLEDCTGARHSRQVVFMPILRAGLAMLDPMLELVPDAGVGHIGIYRCEETLSPQSYFFKSPKLSHAEVFILDPMLATGGSACDSVHKIKSEGATRITMLALIAAPEGVERLSKTHPDVNIVTGALDRGLNSRGYIMPGLGDAGDRFFLT